MSVCGIEFMLFAFDWSIQELLLLVVDDAGVVVQ